MTNHSTPDEAEQHRTNEAEESETNRVAASVTNAASDGSLAFLTGGAVVVRALQNATRGRLRAGIQALAGAALLGVGLRQRRSGGTELAELGSERDDEEQKYTSDDAHTAAERHDVGRQPETDVDGDVTGESDVGSLEDDDSSVTFTDEMDSEPRSKPDLEEVGGDPRRGSDDEGVEIDVSDAALGDEPSEATGPDPEQAQPSRTEDTEPESSPDEDESHVQSDVPGDSTGAGAESAETDDRQDETDAEPTDDGNGTDAESAGQNETDAEPTDQDETEHD